MRRSMPKINGRPIGATYILKHITELSGIVMCAINLPELICMPVTKRKEYKLWVSFTLCRKWYQ